MPSKPPKLSPIWPSWRWESRVYISCWNFSFLNQLSFLMIRFFIAIFHFKQLILNSILLFGHQEVNMIVDKHVCALQKWISASRFESLNRFNVFCSLFDVFHLFIDFYYLLVLEFQISMVRHWGPNHCSDSDLTVIPHLRPQPLNFNNWKVKIES